MKPRIAPQHYFPLKVYVRWARISLSQKPKVRPIESSPPHTGQTYAGNVCVVHTPGNVLAPRNAHQQFLPLNRCVRWAKGGQKYTLSSTDTSVQRQKLLMCISWIKLILWVRSPCASRSKGPGRPRNVSVRLIEVPEAPREFPTPIYVYEGSLKHIPKERKTPHPVKFTRDN